MPLFDPIQFEKSFVELKGRMPTDAEFLGAFKRTTGFKSMPPPPDPFKSKSRFWEGNGLVRTDMGELMSTSMSLTKKVGMAHRDKQVVKAMRKPDPRPVFHKAPNRVQENALKAKEPHGGHGLNQNQIEPFIMAGGVGALVGAGAGCYLGGDSKYKPLVVLAGVGVGHMLGHHIYLNQHGDPHHKAPKEHLRNKKIAQIKHHAKQAARHKRLHNPALHHKRKMH